MATTKTFKAITNAWENRYLPDIFYEEPERVDDSMLQELPLWRVITLLVERYSDRPDVFMSGMVFVSYDVTNGNARLAPDFFISFDVPNHAIRQNLPNYWIWEIGKAPDFALEVASPSTAQNDLGHKRDMYAELGIREYWRFDPTGGELYGQPLAGERLIDGEYQPYEIRVEPSGSLKAYSELIGVDFFWDGDEFDVLDPETGITIDKRLEAEARADTAEERADEAEVRANIEERRANVAETRASSEERRANAAETRVSLEERRANAAEARANAESAARLAQSHQAQARERELLDEIERLRRQQAEN